MNNKSLKNIQINNRQYIVPERPIVVICIDGCDPDYLNAALKVDCIPTIKHFINDGTYRIAHSVIPSFTNPNNMSIATGEPPLVHGICGNYLLDPENGEEVMMNDVKFLRAPTIFKKFQEINKKIAIVTAKDKLRSLLGAELKIGANHARCFSSEKADQANLIDNGITDVEGWLGLDVPDVYSAELSEFVFASGLKLMEDWQPDIMYLTTTDYVQHKYSPEDKKALEFYKMIDDYISEINEYEVTIVITADHGMKPKHNIGGEPEVIFIQDYLDDWLGNSKAKVILPITDPYVVHHGALGSYATIYFENSNDINISRDKLFKLPEIEEVFTKQEAVERFKLPSDRIGDLVIISIEKMTIGKTATYHNLEALKEPLRSHGGLSEQLVPFIINKPYELPSAPYLYNYDAFYYACAASEKH